jgi:hypothetical protein
MRVRSAWWSVLAVAAAVPAWAGSSGSISVQLNIGNAPPPPVVVYQESPPVVIVPGSAVYVVNDSRCGYDFFRFGVYWYIWNDGYFYRARSYNGPFRVIEARYVPAAIWNVPSRHWKRHPHGGPPGLMKGRSRGDNYAVERHHGRGRGHDDD